MTVPPIPYCPIEVTFSSTIQYFPVLCYSYQCYPYTYLLLPGVFDGRPADYLFMLIFNWLCLLVSLHSNLEKQWKITYTSGPLGFLLKWYIKALFDPYISDISPLLLGLDQCQVANCLLWVFTFPQHVQGHLSNSIVCDFIKHQSMLGLGGIRQTILTRVVGLRHEMKAQGSGNSTYLSYCLMSRQAVGARGRGITQP